jgi:hypothetical protein
MGEIADAMIDGEFDYITGEYLGRGVGYPRTRDDERQNNVAGVRKYLKNKGYFSKQEQTKVIRAYLSPERIVELFKGAKIDNIATEQFCVIISCEFGKFVNYVGKLSAQSNGAT